MTDPDKPSVPFPFPLDEFDEDTQLTAGLLSHDLVVQVRDAFNKHTKAAIDKTFAMRMALLEVLAKTMLDAAISGVQTNQLAAMYARLATSKADAEAAVKMVSHLSAEDPIILMLMKMGAPEPFSIVAHLESSEAAARQHLHTQENKEEKSSEIPTVDSDKL